MRARIDSDTKTWATEAVKAMGKLRVLLASLVEQEPLPARSPAARHLDRRPESETQPFLRTRSTSITDHNTSETDNRVSESPPPSATRSKV